MWLTVKSFKVSTNLKTKLRPQKITNQRTSKHNCKNHLPRGVEPLAEFNVQANWTKSFVKKIVFCIKENTHNKKKQERTTMILSYAFGWFT
jgi:hypothetical protein